MDCKVTLKNLRISAQINEAFSRTSYSLAVCNDSSQTVESAIIFPTNKWTAIEKIIVDGEETAQSVIFAKQKAEEKFTDSIAQGNTTVITNLTEGDEDLLISIGNLKSQSQVIVTILTSRVTAMNDKSFSYSLDTARLPFVSNSSTVEASFQAEILSYSALTRVAVNYNSEFSNILTNESKTNCVVTIKSLVTTQSLKTVHIRFRNQSMATGSSCIFEEFDPTTELYSYSISMVVDEYRNVPTQPEIDFSNQVEYKNYDSEVVNDYPASFIFLVDQSGSMDGSSIDIAKQALNLFIKSLPLGSEYEIIGFGSDFKKYFTTSLKVDESGTSMDLAMKTISGLRADLGGTDLLKPLSSIFKTSSSSGALCKQLFILTDGEVDNSIDCIKLVSQFASEFNIYSFGIGQSVDTAFVTNLAAVSGGVCQIVRDLANLKASVIESLNTALRPYYSQLSLHLPSSIEKYVYFDSSNVRKFHFQDTKLYFAFVSKNKLNAEDDVAIQYFNASTQSSISRKVDVSKLNLLPNGDILTKAIIGAYISNCTTATNSKEIEELSIKYQVLSKHTSLFLQIDSNQKLVGTVKTCVFKKQEIKQQDYCSLGIVNNTYDDYDDYDEYDEDKESCDYYQYEKSCCGTKSAYSPPQMSRRNVNFCTNSCDVSYATPKSLPLTNQIQAKHDKSQEKWFDLIVMAQESTGLWLRTKININDFIQKFNKEFETFEKEIQKMSINKNFDDVLITVFIVFLLQTEFKSFKDEYKLLVNKSKKYLKSSGLDIESLGI